MRLDRGAIRLAGVHLGGEGRAALLHLDAPEGWRAAVSRFLDALHAR